MMKLFSKVTFNHIDDNSIVKELNNQKLSLVDSKELWSSNPICISNTELDLIKNKDHVYSVLKNTDNRPSKWAGLNPQEISSALIKSFDSEYETSMAKYKISIDLATQNDMKKIVELGKNNKWFFIGGSLSSTGIGAGSGFLIAGPPGAGVGAIVGFFSGLTTTGIFRTIYVLREGSFNRIKSLYEIDRDEKDRMNDIWARVTEKAKTLIDTLREFKLKNISTNDVVKELKELDKFFTTIFKKTLLDNNLLPSNEAYLLQ